MRRYKPQRLTILNIETGELAKVLVKTYLRAAHRDTRQRFRPFLRIGRPPHRNFYLNDEAFCDAIALDRTLKRDRSRREI